MVNAVLCRTLSVRKLKGWSRATPIADIVWFFNYSRLHSILGSWSLTLRSEKCQKIAGNATFTLPRHDAYQFCKEQKYYRFFRGLDCWQDKRIAAFMRFHKASCCPLFLATWWSPIFEARFGANLGVKFGAGMSWVRWGFGKHLSSSRNNGPRGMIHSISIKMIGCHQ